MRRALVALALIGCSSDPVIPPQDLANLPIEERIGVLLDQLTIEEKVAQMHGTSIAPVDDLFLTAENGLWRLMRPLWRAASTSRWRGRWRKSRSFC